jgi:hypothetical protein
MKANVEKIRHLIQNSTHYTVDAELDREVLGTARKSPIVSQAEVLADESLLSLDWIVPWLKRSLRQFVRVIALLAFLFAGIWIYVQGSYSVHLDNAKVALGELENRLEAKTSPSASDEENLKGWDESQLAGLGSLVVHETERAIQIAEKKSDPVALQKALNEIGAVEDESIQSMQSVAEKMVSSDFARSVGTSIQNTKTDRSMVKKADDFLAQSIAKGEKEVAIDIQVSSDIQSSDGKVSQPPAESLPSLPKIPTANGI